MKRILAGFLFTSLTVCFIVTVSGAEIKVPGRTNSLVNDYAQVLSSEARAYLQKLLNETRGADFTGTEIEISTFKTLGGMPFDHFMQEYARRWRRPVLLENDNRIHIVLISGEQKVRMGVGKYVQEIITTDIAKDIMDNVMIPEFAKGNYDEGFKKGAGAIIELLNKGNLPKSRAFMYAKILVRITLLIIFATVILFFLLRRIRSS
jgi:uncharacterized protein